MMAGTMGMGALFVDDWSIEDTLGEGGFGEVKLLVNRHTGEAVAMKTMDLRDQPPANRDLVRKEICIHKLLTAPNIIRFYGDRSEGDVVYMFLEYAPGGALYDHIDTLGMGCCKTQKYFRELLTGVEYMHSVGIVHRDIKPENLLLDINGTLKICDFGLATKFRHLGKERILHSRCGTLQYVAPEVISRMYLGPPADIWSCGIVFVAMLTGDVPWAEPSRTCTDYLNWINNANPTALPWSLMDTMALSLVKKLLMPEPRERYKIKQIFQHRWMLQRFEPEAFDSSSEGITSPPNSQDELVDISVRIYEADCGVDSRSCASQPLPHLAEEGGSYTGAKFSFSQPTDVEALLLSSQAYEANQEPKFQNLVRRMTRFFVSTSCEEALEALRNHLEKNGYRLKRNDAMITVTTQDKVQNPLVFKATALTMGEKTLLDFRLSKGCGLAFKREFSLIKASLSKIVLKGIISCAVSAATITG